MMKMKAAAVAALAALALAGCGGTAAATHAAAPAVTASQDVSWPSARAIAAQVGATDVQRIDPTLYASDEVTAVWHGRDVDIATFASPQLRDNWVQAAQQFTPVMTVGPQFAITDDGPAA